MTGFFVSVRRLIAEIYTTLAASSGASLVGYLPNGIGAVIRSVLLKLRETVSFLDFGAVGDGVADDTTAIQAAFTYASANNKKIVDNTGSIYKYTSNINSGGVEIEGNCTFNGVGAFIDIAGSLTQIGTVAAATTAGKNTATLSAVVGLAVGDLVIIQNTTPFSFSAHRTAYYDGEYARISAINTGTKVVTFESDLISSYLGVVTNKVFKVNAIKANISGCSFTGTGVFALRIQYAENSTIQPTEVKTTGTSSALILNKCYRMNVVGGKYRLPYAGGGEEYGINVVNSQHIAIQNVDAFGGRHGITTGGDDANGSVPCRFITIDDSIVTNAPASGVYAADFHGNTTDSVYRNCQINGAVGLAGQNIGAIECRVTTWPNYNAPALGYHELVGGDCVFENNKVVVGDGSTATEIVGNLSSGLTANITKPYTIIVDGLDATLNASITRLVNAYENSGQANAWILRRFGIRGTFSGLASLVAFAKVAPGIDASFIFVQDPLFDTTAYTVVALSGTTLAGCRFLQPQYNGANANGSFTKFPDGTMICRVPFSAVTDIATAFLGGFRSGGLTWTFPAPFLAGTSPQVTITPSGASAISASISTTGVTDTLFFLVAIATQGSATRTADLVAVGRWY